MKRRDQPLPPQEPPFVELSFYFEQSPDMQSMQRVVDSLSARGAKSNFHATVHAPEDSTKPFGGPSDFARQDVRISQLDNLAEQIDSETRLVSVEVAGAFRYDPKHCATVTYGATQNQQGWSRGERGVHRYN
jgi:hypothetical protein